jgi:enoyl-CoA hydratase/carnithine racemase
MAQSSPSVLYECRDGVGLITFNRPEQLNSWGVIADGYFDALDQAAADPDCRVVVVVGSGRAWCAGADVQGQGQMWDKKDKSAKAPGTSPAAAKPSEDSDMARRRTEYKARMDAGIVTDSKGRWANHAQTVPKLVVACVNGAVAGGGFSQIMNCDVRFAAAGAPFASAFARRGLIAEHGVSRTLVEAVGMGTAMDLLVSGRKIRAEEALQLGIVQRVYPKEELLEATLAYARDVAINVPPSSMAVIKRQILTNQYMPMMDVMKESNRLMMESFKVPEHREGVRSFLEKRKPTFPPYSTGNSLVALMNAIQASKL